MNLEPHRISGRFDVSMQPEPAAPDAPGAEPIAAPIAAPGATLGVMRLAKRYHGPLEATGSGRMFSAVTPTAGSAGYVALECVTGTLEGRRGSFVIQHHGLMDRGAKRLVIDVVPDSATGELAGLRGHMGIRIEAGGAHHYDFEYTLPTLPAT